MKILRFLGFTLILVCCCATAMAKSTIIRANSFAVVKKLILAAKHPKNALLVLDDDDTLTMMPCSSPENCQYIGGPAWYHWQEHLPANSKDRITNDFSKLIAVNRLILETSRMPLVESDIPNILNAAHRLGMPILVATARGDHMLDATETQLSEDHILKIIKQNALLTPTGHAGFPDYYLPKGPKNKTMRPITYHNGILYLAGQNKGLMLKDFLKKTGHAKNIKRIIFVDDTYRNVRDVANTYKHDPSMKATSIWYTHLKKHKANFLHSKHLQTIATKRWRAIHATLKKNLPGFSV